ncbi:MAG: FtsX-like permease family protein [Anaerolineae bacterium]|nr:FtsX-like permease family protein [Anaerolineae bacterium]
MTRLAFYLRYAFRNITRGGRWTTLAIFSIAAGVATVVALRGLGLAIGDSLIENIAVELKGDVLVYKGNFGDGFGASFGSEDSAYFNDNSVQNILRWAEDRGATASPFVRGSAVQVSRIGEDGEQSVGGITSSFGDVSFISTTYIEPGNYPSNYQITALDPAGVPLGDLFTDDLDAVISQNLADQQNIGVGDHIRISGTEDEFIVRGIVDTSQEAGLRNIFSSFFGFMYLEMDDVQRSINPDIRPNAIAIDFPDSTVLTPDFINQSIEELRDLSRDGEWTRAEDVFELLEGYTAISQILGDFIVVMGLGALLIGGVGIMNTMIVMVRRRTTEIAAVKTFGLKGRQVAAMFLTEGLLLGFMGSVIGCVIGVLLGGVVNHYGETFLQQALPWRIYPEALLYGMTLGMVITAIFGLAPILTALQVRPGIILRPNETHVPSLGIFQTIGLMLLVTFLIGLIVGQIIRPSFLLGPDTFVQENPYFPYLVGVIGVAATLAFLGVLVMVLWVIVWIVGKLPSFGIVELRLALRNLSTNRLRTATTLLALSAGMFALSSITFVGEGTRELLNLQLTSQLGGNVLAFPISPGALSSVGSLAVKAALSNVEGIKSSNSFNPYPADLIAINGQPIDIEGVPQRTENGSRFMDSDVDFLDPKVQAYFQWDNFVVWETNNDALYDRLSTIVRGRNLSTEDIGQPYLIGPLQTAEVLGIDVGSVLTYRVGNRNYDIEVIGLSGASAQSMMGSGGSVIVAPGVIQSAASFQFYTFDVEEESINQALVNLSAIRIPPTFAIDVSFIDTLVSRLINQFAALPTVVGLLSLAAAAVIMANTVALATLERRRQIGILKAIGLRSNRVLAVMLIETVIIALLSAVLGIGLSSLFVTLFTGLSGTPIPLPTDSRLAALALVGAAVLIGLISTFLSANVAIRERVMNVLRYE